MYQAKHKEMLNAFNKAVQEDLGEDDFCFIATVEGKVCCFRPKQIVGISFDEDDFQATGLELEIFDPYRSTT